ncbi:hypothetical protein [Marisediminicola sp. LYQ134]|uniref:hypothetical protein n=1 Tax=Marisediminicola sp. LYQ134 TaxID=3391061 RepID=UPI00398395FB
MVVALVAIVIVAIILGMQRSDGRGAGDDDVDPGPTSAPFPSAYPTPAEPLDPEEPGEQDGQDSADPPLALDEPGELETGLAASISRLEAVEGEATLPGEVAGASVRFRVTIDNTTEESVDLRYTVIDVSYGSDQTPALALTEPGGSPLPTEVGAGESVEGTYVFRVPEEERGSGRIIVDYFVGVPPLVFEGTFPE